MFNERIIAYRINICQVNKARARQEDGTSRWINDIEAVEWIEIYSLPRCTTPYDIVTKIDSY